MPNIPRPDEPADEDEVEVLTEKSLSEEDVQWLKELYSFGKFLGCRGTYEF